MGGPFAAPKAVYIVPDLPKTRSGKIMRRIMRKILAGEEDQLGDITTLSDPSVVDKIIDIVHQSKEINGSTWLGWAWLPWEGSIRSSASVVGRNSVALGGNKRRAMAVL